MGIQILTAFALGILATEAWAAGAHRLLWHGPLWRIHASHHRARQQHCVWGAPHAPSRHPDPGYGVGVGPDDGRRHAGPC